MNVLAGLAGRSAQIEDLAASLSAAVFDHDIEHATEQLRRLREEVGLTEISLAVLKSRTHSTATLPIAEAPAVAASSDDHEGLESQERVLCERIIAVAFHVGTLEQASDSMRTLHFLSEQIGKLNTEWLWAKRTDRGEALVRARVTLRALGRHPDVIRLLHDASRGGSKQVRAACVVLAALLDIELAECRP